MSFKEIILSPRRKSRITNRKSSYQQSTVEAFFCRKNYFLVQKKATASLVSSPATKKIAQKASQKATKKHE